MALEPATIRRIATLARIHVEDAELATLQAEMNGILGWIEQLNEVNVDGVEPLTGSAQMALKMRDDVVTDGFFIASEGFKISAEELALTALDITSDGYVGLQSGTTVNQVANPTLRVAMRGFSKEPQATLAAELNGILGWIEQLNEVNVDGIEPLTGAQQMALKMREDVVTDGGYPDKVLANAPERAGDFFAVPKVVE